MTDARHIVSAPAPAGAPELADCAPAPSLAPFPSEEALKAARQAAGRNQIVLLAPGEPLPECRPGDFLLVHGTALLSRLIRFGERFRHTKCAAQWSHAALVVSDGKLIEALARGIKQTEATKYDKRWRALIRVVGSDEARGNAVRYAESCLNEQYGFIDFVSVIGSQLFGFGVVLTTARAQICSELVAHALERLGYIFPKTPELTSPADLYTLFSAKS